MTSPSAHPGTIRTNEWRRLNPEKYKQWRKAYCIKHAEAKKAYRIAYRIKYPEKSREQDRRHQEKERLRLGPLYAQRKREYRLRNGDKIKDSDAAWRRRRKLSLINMLGGKCIKCGDTRLAVLEFHHKNPKAKLFGICEGIGRRFPEERMISEASKCEVLCANCHALHHWKKLASDFEVSADGKTLIASPHQPAKPVTEASAF